ncbi:MAG TPA: response regulator [Thermoanaerobaculia bacterium]|nr:response regulator [Thermoanaerobaculia bacterium]
MSSEGAVLIADDNLASIAELRTCLAESGLALDSAVDSLDAIEQLRSKHYRAVVLDPMIRHRLNGYAVLDFIELHQPELLPRVFLLTEMSPQTIRRTAPALLPRLFRKSSDLARLAASLIVSSRLPVREPEAAKRSVLLVEDDATTAGAAIEVLEQLGYSCLWLANGGDVLDAVSSAQFGTILLDLVMPDVDGFMVLERLALRRPELLRRVIVMTGMPDKYLDEIRSRRICGVLQKPLTVGKLQRLLDRCGGVIPFESGGELASFA